MALFGQSEKTCEIKEGSQEMAVMVWLMAIF